MHFMCEKINKKKYSHYCHELNLKKIKQPTCANSINYIWNNPNQNPTLRNLVLSWMLLNKKQYVHGKKDL